MKVKAKNVRRPIPGKRLTCVRCGGSWKRQYAPIAKEVEGFVDGLLKRLGEDTFVLMFNYERERLRQILREELDVLFVAQCPRCTTRYWRTPVQYPERRERARAMRSAKAARQAQREAQGETRGAAPATDAATTTPSGPATSARR